jgi:tripartite-type tricarboxylate transporter receptor subunit TctC
MMPWYGIFLPARAQTSVVQRLNAETNSILGDPDFGKRLGELGTALDGGTPERLADLVKSDLKLYGDIVKAANIPQE